ncbi:hypothetical protein [Amycolatopsis sp. NBC_01286]|uniref:hypothetical protein n=1 Tax=Amycolatopsis sp. NBC_01286 TaxID=2903560 RepID=UPI002E1327FA|nr:hypothetical protein OG570_26630 [Amycolatopsis sp. NBC_01286]
MSATRALWCCFHRSPFLVGKSGDVGPPAGGCSPKALVVGDRVAPAESRAYLGRKLAGQAHLADEVAELAGELGHLPLALAQAAVYLLDRQIPCSEYRRRFARRKLEAVLPDRHSLPGDHQATVAAT